MNAAGQVYTFSSNTVLNDVPVIIYSGQLPGQ